mgnify:CR=1 FL=1
MEQILDEVLPKDVENRKTLIVRCIFSIRNEYIKIYPEHTRLVEGAKEVLKTLREKKILVGIVTSQTIPADLVRLNLKRFNVESFVDTIVTFNDVPKRKPAPDGILECAKRLGVKTNECVVVGDAEADVQAGKAAGAKTIVVVGGVATRESLSKEKPDIILNNLQELTTILE